MAVIASFKLKAKEHLKLINFKRGVSSTSFQNDMTHTVEEITTAPVFSSLAQTVIESQRDETFGNFQKQNVYPQYGLLGYRIQDPPPEQSHEGLVYANVSAPWSAFICGSQGSGKSHTLSCLLENCMISPSPAGNLTSPLAGMILHYDKFTAFSCCQICEAAYLCSAKMPVRVLVSPTNYLAMKKAYSNLPGLGDASNFLTVEPMYLPKKGLTISMMRSLMGIADKKSQPLYIEVSLLYEHLAHRFNK